MYKILALISGEAHWRVHSYLIRLILLARGIKVGKNFRIHGMPVLKIRGNPSNISIGNNVFIGGDIDLRNREGGKIVIEDGVAIDDNCRFVSANNALLKIGKYTAMGRDCIFNCGADVILGEKCLIASAVHINSSDHMISGSKFIRDQGYSHAPVIIGNDVFIGSHAVIKKGVSIGNGAVIGAHSVVTKNIPEYSINTGAPAETIKYRE